MLDLHWNHILRLGSIFGALGVVASCSGTGAAVRSSSANGNDVTGNGDTTTGGTLTTTGGMINTPIDGGSGFADDSGTHCQAGTLKFVPQIPTVFILVDRSGSMFDSMAWEPLRTGTLAVVKELESKVKFGFGAFTGEVGQTCPMFDKVPVALNNSDAIAALYNKLGKPQKGETPTAKVLSQVRDILRAETGPGEKYILFVTDGEPDYCDDPNPICPVDSVVAALQALS